MFGAPLLPSDVQEPAELLEKIRARRPKGELLNLDRKLLNSAPFCQGWSILCGNVRSKLLALCSHTMELAILTTAVVNQVPYEYLHHVGPYLDSSKEGEEERALNQVAFLQATLACSDSDGSSLLESALFNDDEKLVIKIAAAMSAFDTSDVARGTTRTLLAAFESRHGATATTELVGAISTYNMVGRFLVYCDVQPEREWEIAAEEVVKAFKTKRSLWS